MPARLPVGTWGASRTCQQHIIQAHHQAGRVQAWPLPLTGAGLIQNLHQVVVDETVKHQKYNNNLYS